MVSSRDGDDGGVGQMVSLAIVFVSCIQCVFPLHMHAEVTLIARDVRAW